jgi:PleD family two-component response regulator
VVDRTNFATESVARLGEGVVCLRRQGGAQTRPILIVEDEQIMRESLRDWLADGGCSVEMACNGEEALSTVTERDCGFLILDFSFLERTALRCCGPPSGCGRM